MFLHRSDALSPALEFTGMAAAHEFVRPKRTVTGVSDSSPCCCSSALLAARCELRMVHCRQYLALSRLLVRSTGRSDFSFDLAPMNCSRIRIHSAYALVRFGPHLFLLCSLMADVSEQFGQT